MEIDAIPVAEAGESVRAPAYDAFTLRFEAVSIGVALLKLPRTRLAHPAVVALFAEIDTRVAAACGTGRGGTAGGAAADSAALRGANGDMGRTDARATRRGGTAPTRTPRRSGTATIRTSSRGGASAAGAGRAVAAPSV